MAEKRIVWKYVCFIRYFDFYQLVYVCEIFV